MQRAFWRASVVNVKRPDNPSKVHLFEFDGRIDEYGLWSVCHQMQLARSVDVAGKEVPCKLCVWSAAKRVAAGTLVVADLHRR